VPISTDVHFAVEQGTPPSGGVPATSPRWAGYRSVRLQAEAAEAGEAKLPTMQSGFVPRYAASVAIIGFGAAPWPGFRRNW
jgi:hypothetical protein